MRSIRAYADERWWVFALFAGLAIVLIRLAYTLVGRRDVGAGLLADRLGAPRGSLGLRNPLALAIRLQWGMWLGWASGMFLLGLFGGSAGKNVGDLVKTSDQLASYIERLGGKQDMTNAYFAATISLFALAITAYGISAVGRARSEETDGRVENLLATPATRASYLLSHAWVAFIGSALVLLALGIGGGIAYAITTHDAGKIPIMIGAAAGQWPAVATFIGFAALMFGLLPRAMGVAWGAFALAAIIGQIGPLLRLPQRVLDLSPFTHAPKLPGGSVDAMPLIVLCLVGVALTAAGLVGFRRRDIG